MKAIKKVCALVLALCMCLSVSATAFAASECSITIENSVLGSTYNAYKIFDATYDENGNVAYSIKADNLWYTLVTGTEGQDYFIVSEVADVNGNYSVIKNEDVSDDDLIAWIQSCITVDTTTGTGTLSNGENITSAGTTTGTGSTAIISNLDAGYYFVTTTTGSTVSITTAYPNATIIDKNTPPSIEKVIVHEDGENGDHYEADGMGEEVNFDVTASVPLYEGSNYVIDYVITDSMSNGLLIELSDDDFTYDETTGKYYLTDEMINEWVTLYDGTGEEVDDDFTDFVYNYSFELLGYDVYTDEIAGSTYHTFSGFVLTYYTFDYEKFEEDYNNALEVWIASGGTEENFDFYLEDYIDESKYPANASLEIAYSAHVSSLEGYENTNVITLDHDITPWNHPYKPTPGETYTSRDYIYSWELQIVKVDGEDEVTPLPGATFTLYSASMQDVKVGHSWLYVPISLFNNGVYTATDGTSYKFDDFESTHYVQDDDGNYVVGEGASNEDTFVRILTGDASVSDTTTTHTATATTDENGMLYFEGLGTGVFVLTEIVAPDGYNLLEDPIIFQITFEETGDDATGYEGVFTVTYGSLDEENLFVPDSVNDDNGTLNDNYIMVETIENNSGTLLPSTGGMGTTIFYVVGICLMLGAAVVLITRRRMHAQG